MQVSCVSVGLEGGGAGRTWGANQLIKYQSFRTRRNKLGLIELETCRGMERGCKVKSRKIDRLIDR